MDTIKRKRFIRTYGILLLLLFFFTCSFAQDEVIPRGSFIVDLGAVPQTVANGLKPYGLVYELLQTYKVPVKWIINSSKNKDGIDFTYKGKDYRGGSFAVLEKYRTEQVNDAINNWKAKGVTGEDTDSDITLPVFATLTFAPRWTIDAASADLVLPFFTNAEIPNTALKSSSSASPTELGPCDDIYVLPHADPTWSSHKNILFWNEKYKGAIWVGCHSASVLENLTGTENGNQYQMNFLTTGGLVPWNTHTHGSPPYTYNSPGDPVMQFIGSMDTASYNGSENIYLLQPGSHWRNSVKTYVIDPDQPDVPSLSPGPAVAVAFGRAFDDPNRGLVMYQAGHYYNGVEQDPYVGLEEKFGPAHVALQRAFFNFSFLAMLDKQVTAVSAEINTADTMERGVEYPITFTVPANVTISNYSLIWAASSGGIKPDFTSSNITYTPAYNSAEQTVLISLTLKDACGREFYSSKKVVLLPCLKDTASTFSINTVDLMESNNSYDITAVSDKNNLDKFSIKWTVSTGKITSADTSGQIKLYLPFATADDQIIISATLHDSCGFDYPITKIIKIKQEDGIHISKLLSPNEDGLGYDYLLIRNINKYPDNEINIYNRWGNVVYEAKNYDNKTTIFKGFGKNGKTLTEGVYYYLLNLYTYRGQDKVTSAIKGYFILKR